MAKRDYQAIANKQIRKSKESVDDYREGVNGVTTAPGQAAAGKQDKMKAGILKAIDSGKWAENTKAVSLSEWQQKTAGKGADRYASGVEDASDKITAFHMDFGPMRDAVADKVNAMPDATPEQRKAKMNANFDGMSKLSYRRKRR